MKKILVLGIAATMLLVNLTSCKKGENDPFLSLRTRKARLTGKWVVTNSETLSTYTSTPNMELSPVINVDSQTTSYDGKTETLIKTSTTDGITTTNSSTSVYTQEFEFVKDGTFTVTIVAVNGTQIIKGNWIFLGKNKDEKLKNKESILLNYIDFSYTDISGVTSSSIQTGFQGNSTIFIIDELRSKEIIFKNEYSNSQSSNIYSSSGKTSFTLKTK